MGDKYNNTQRKVHHLEYWFCLVFLDLEAFGKHSAMVCDHLRICLAECLASVYNVSGIFNKISERVSTISVQPGQLCNYFGILLCSLGMTQRGQQIYQSGANA